MIKIEKVRIWSGSVSRLVSVEPDLEGTFIINGCAESLEEMASFIQLAPEMYKTLKAINDLANEKDSPRDSTWVLFQKLLKESDAGHQLKDVLEKLAKIEDTRLEDTND